MSENPAEQASLHQASANQLSIQSSPSRRATPSPHNDGLSSTGTIIRAEVLDLGRILGLNKEDQVKVEDLVRFAEGGIITMNRSDIVTIAIGFLNLRNTSRTQQDVSKLLEIVNDRDIERLGLLQPRDHTNATITSLQSDIAKLSSSVTELIGVKRTSGTEDRSGAPAKKARAATKSKSGKVSVRDSVDFTFDETAVRRLTGRVFYSTFVTDRRTESSLTHDLTYAVLVQDDFKMLRELAPSISREQFDKAMSDPAECARRAIETVVRDKVNKLRNKTLVDSFDSIGLNPDKPGSAKNLLRFSVSLLADYRKELCMADIELMAFFRYAAKEFVARTFLETKDDNMEPSLRSKNNPIWYTQVDDGLFELYEKAESEGAGEVEKARAARTRLYRSLIDSDLAEHGGELENVLEGISPFDKDLVPLLRTLPGQA